MPQLSGLMAAAKSHSAHAGGDRGLPCLSSNYFLSSHTPLFLCTVTLHHLASFSTFSLHLLQPQTKQCRGENTAVAGEEDGAGKLCYRLLHGGRNGNERRIPWIEMLQSSTGLMRKESNTEIPSIFIKSLQLLVALQNPTDLHLRFLNLESSNCCNPPTSSPTVIFSLILPALLRSIKITSDRFLCASLVCPYSSRPWYLHSSVDTVGFALCLSSS